MKTLLIVVISLSLSACIVHPHKHKSIAAKKQAKLEKKLKNNDKTVIIVKGKSYKKKNCKRIKQIWTCNDKTRK